MDVSKFDLSEYSMALPTIEKLSYCKKLSGLDLNNVLSKHLWLLYYATVELHLSQFLPTDLLLPTKELLHVSNTHPTLKKMDMWKYIS